MSTHTKPSSENHVCLRGPPELYGPTPCSAQVQTEQFALGFVQSCFKLLPAEPVPIYHGSEVSCPIVSVILVRSRLWNCAQTFNSSCLLPVLCACASSFALGERQRIPGAGHATFWSSCGFPLPLILARSLAQQREEFRAHGGTVSNGIWADSVFIHSYADITYI